MDDLIRQAITEERSVLTDEGQIFYFSSDNVKLINPTTGKMSKISKAEINRIMKTKPKIRIEKHEEPEEAPKPKRQTPQYVEEEQVKPKRKVERSHIETSTIDPVEYAETKIKLEYTKAELDALSAKHAKKKEALRQYKELVESLPVDDYRGQGLSKEQKRQEKIAKHTAKLAKYSSGEAESYVPTQSNYSLPLNSFFYNT
jgi:hypothetical protein